MNQILVGTHRAQESQCRHRVFAHKGKNGKQGVDMTARSNCDHFSTSLGVLRIQALGLASWPECRFVNRCKNRCGARLFLFSKDTIKAQMAETREIEKVLIAV